MQNELTTRLQDAIRAGNIGTWRAEDNFPRYVWCNIDDEMYEGRVVNDGKGEYKGYPLEPDEWPEGV